MVLFRLGIISLFIGLFNTMYSQVVGSYYSQMTGVRISLFENNTYKCWYPQVSIVGDLKQEHVHNGVWFSCDSNSIVLNSYKQPDIFPILSVQENFNRELEKDSISEFVFLPGGGFIYQGMDSIMSFGPSKIIINNEEFQIPQNGVLRIKKDQPFKTFTLLSPRYHSEQYMVKKSTTNQVEIRISDNKNLFFPRGSYFKNERLIMKKDTLIYKMVVNLVKEY
mgnify:CR=1 FL=1